jgi:hypothetical protein
VLTCAATPWLLEVLMRQGKQNEAKWVWDKALIDNKSAAFLQRITAIGASFAPTPGGVSA